jgi:hypothetical protein
MAAVSEFRRDVLVSIRPFYASRILDGAVRNPVGILLGAFCG